MVEQKEIRKYNGWTNYETWAVNLWLGNEECSANYWDSVSLGFYQSDGPEGKYLLADRLKEEVSEAAPDLGPCVYSDLLGSALDEVDWVEIAEAMLDQHESF